VSGNPVPVRTVCPAPCYDACGMLAHVDGGRVVRVEGDPDHRITRGRLCPRADRYVEQTYHPDRLLRPMRRVGAPGTDSFEPISWDDAIGRIADALKSLARDFDPRALVYVTGNGQNGAMTPFGPLFLAHFGGHSTAFGDLCNHAGMEATRLTFGTLHHHPPEDYLRSRLIVVWGKNPALTSPHQWRFLEEARAKGARLVCIDPRRTETAIGCDEHLAPLPGTDGFLANCIAHVLVDDGLVDRAYVASHVHGYGDYEAMVRLYEPAKAAAVCGIDGETVRAFARRYAATRPANFSVGFGVQRYRNGGQAVRAIAALQAITGNIGISGGGFDFANQAAFVTRPFPFQTKTSPRVRQLGALARLGRSILGAKDPPVRAAIVERANPVSQAPYSPSVHYALTRLDFVCVIDRFLTDTARRADVVLPAKSMFEETDVVPGLWHGILRLRPKCAEPPGEVRTEREIYRALADAMGFPTEQFDIEPEELLNRVLPGGLSPRRLKREAFDRHGPTFVPFQDQTFATASRKIELRSEAAELAWRVDPLPFFSPPRECASEDPDRARRYPLHLLTPKSAYRQASQWGNDPALRAAAAGEGLAIHPDDAAGRGIADGARVRVFNDRGELFVRARLDPGIRREVVSLPSGSWLAVDGYSVNVLTQDDVTDMGHGATFFDCLVEVEVAK